MELIEKNMDKKTSTQRQTLEHNFRLPLFFTFVAGCALVFVIIRAVEVNKNENVSNTQVNAPKNVTVINPHLTQYERDLLRYLSISDDEKGRDEKTRKERVQQERVQQERVQQQKQKQKQREYELNELRKKMTSKVDKIEGIKWIYEKTTKRYIDKAATKRNFFYVYLGQNMENESSLWGRLFIGVRKSDWIFFDTVIINFDGERRTFNFPSFQVDRDVLGGSVIQEHIDVSFSEYIPALKKIAESKTVQVRLKGKYYYDFTLTKEQKNAIKNIIRLYELMR